MLIKVRGLCSQWGLRSQEQARAAAGLWGEAGGGAAQSQGIQEERERSKEGEFGFRHIGST